MVRFSVDVDNLDMQLSPQFSHIAMNVFMLISTLIVLINASPWFLIPLALVAIALLRLQRYSRPDLVLLTHSTCSPRICAPPA